MRWLRSMAGAAVIAVVLAAGAVGWLWNGLHQPGPLPPGGALVSVPPGEPFRATIKRLRTAGVVRDTWPLKLWARWTGSDRLVQSGDYRFEQPFSPLQVLAMLRSPAAALHRVTVPEGTTLKQIALALERAGFGGADEFLCLALDPDFLAALDVPATGLEGYLFPDTYAFAWSMSPADVLTAMVRRFRERIVPLQERRLDAGASEQEMVTMGSLIEKETGAAHERKLVSAVFHNRLRLGMMLQSDPTTVYGRDVDGAPTAGDLGVESPYNTYLHAGLPPGPICNPGIAAMEAAIEPAAVGYLYFVARDDGTHTFSRTLEDHNRAVAARRRGAS